MIGSDSYHQRNMKRIQGVKDSERCGIYDPGILASEGCLFFSSVKPSG
jgi:hypothetical protein